MLLRCASVLALAVACSAAEPDGAEPGTGEAGSGHAGSSSFGGESSAGGGDSAAKGGAAGTGEAGSGHAGNPSFAGQSGSSAEGAAGSSDAGGAAGAVAGSAGESNADAAYAHVTAVSASGSDGAYTFSVSVESDDIDCTQFADFWEVLGEDGSLLYRRILEHSHTDENGTTDAGAPGNTFTRDGGPVAIDATSVVIVRAHMNTSAYNGRAMRGSVGAGFAHAPNIDSTFAAGVEDDMPVPDGCLF